MTIKLRLDVDYPYPSRSKSFLYIAFGIKKRKGKDYLKNARVIAKMINESPKDVMAYWFFTPFTIPDKELLDLLNPQRHEVALHVAINPYREWKILENETDRTVQYYTIHGTSRIFTQLLWGRKLGEKQAKVPADFPVKSFHEFTTFSLDRICFQLGFDGGIREANAWIRQDFVLSMHPEWLFKKGKRSQRGPFYEVLQEILKTYQEMKTLKITSNHFVRIGRNVSDYGKGVVPTDEYLEKVIERGVDVFVLPEQSWHCLIPNPPSSWKKSKDNVALLEIKSYDDWLNKVGKKTRNMVRKAEKSGIRVAVAEPSDRLAEGISKIFNETPIRQGSFFTHYGESLSTVAGNMYEGAKSSTFIVAYLNEEMVGFIQINWGDIAVLSQILSMQKHWDKAVNNALLAKAVEVCALRGQQWLVYGRIGNHPSLDKFKKSNGFESRPITSYYVPLTRRGKIAVRLGLHRELRDAVPKQLKVLTIPVRNWASRVKARYRFRSETESAVVNNSNDAPAANKDFEERNLD